MSGHRHGAVSSKPKNVYGTCANTRAGNRAFTHYRFSTRTPCPCQPTSPPLPLSPQSVAQKTTLAVGSRSFLRSSSAANRSTNTKNCAQLSSPMPPKLILSRLTPMPLHRPVSSHRRRRRLFRQQQHLQRRWQHHVSMSTSTKALSPAPS